ncbi:MAG: hypothetical protein P8J45_01770 [Phycisphaerales bacterium]|nr:hypothetical protein [Phycisphaerales bacterium]
MTRTSMAGLVLLNVMLLCMLAVVTLGTDESAQASVSGGGRGEYVAVSGTIAGTKTPIIWIVDQASQELVAIQFDAQRDQLVGFGYRNLNNDSVSVRRTRQ